MVGGTLFVVATPLGNLGDLSPRAAEVLGACQVVLAEDTRRTGLLCKRLGIEAARFVSLHEHNEEQRLEAVLGALARGEDAALVSDAGTPLLSDPGYRLVAAAREAGYRVSPVPGPSAVTAALSAAGLPPMPFAFLGFAPRKAAERRRWLEPFAALPSSLVFFERKSRLMDTLAACAEVLGPRRVCLARELTKEHEQFILGRLDDLDGLDAPMRGEFTVVVGPPEAAPATSEADLERLVAEEAARGGRPRDIVRRVMRRASGWNSKTVYDKVRASGASRHGGKDS